MTPEQKLNRVRTAVSLLGEARHELHMLMSESANITEKKRWYETWKVIRRADDMLSDDEERLTGKS